MQMYDKQDNVKRTVSFAMTLYSVLCRTNCT